MAIPSAREAGGRREAVAEPATDLPERVKTALDETRMLILGAQVLIGFQFQFAFGEAFNKLPVALRHLNEVSLVLMMIVVALLVAPSAHAPRSERLQE